MNQMFNCIISAIFIILLNRIYLFTNIINQYKVDRQQQQEQPYHQKDMSFGGVACFSVFIYLNLIFNYITILYTLKTL